jgi:hypothetical protein
VRDAHALIQTFHEKSEWEAEKVKVCTFNANKQKALTILKIQRPTVDDVLTVLKGRKVCSCFKCILGDSNEVCVDGHAYSIWAGEYVPTTKAPSIAKRKYEQIQEDYREAARLVSLTETRNRHQGAIKPAQLQAITWLTHRRLITPRVTVAA